VSSFAARPRTEAPSAQLTHPAPVWYGSRPPVSGKTDSAVGATDVPGNAMGSPGRYRIGSMRLAGGRERAPQSSAGGCLGKREAACGMSGHGAMNAE
jgi:hypothetical protein